MLNADEKSTNSILAYEPRRSRCSRMTFNIDRVASSTLRLVLYANCNGSSRCSTWVNIYFSTILSNDFISSDVRAIDL